jgi:DNA-directed RNA polymerase specialized sigma24 family protein
MCLTQLGLSEKGLAEQAQFLEDRLGLSRKEAAALLGSTAGSLKVLIRRSRKKQAKAKGST